MMVLFLIVLGHTDEQGNLLRGTTSRCPVIRQYLSARGDGLHTLLSPSQSVDLRPSPSHFLMPISFAVEIDDFERFV